MDPIIQQWRDQGFVVVRKVFDPERIARLLPIVEDVWRQSRVRDAVTGEPAPPNDAGHVMFHCNHPDYHRRDPATLAEILAAGADERVLDVPRRLFGEEPLFRTLSLWFSPDRVSSDGNWHRDTQFLFPDETEERARFGSFVDSDFGGSGAQFQIALVRSEDVEYVPGSHKRWDTPAEYAIRRADGAKNWSSNAMPGAVRVALEPGDGVMFNPIGLHRGRYHVDKKRRTFMATLTKTSAPYFDSFSTQPWFLTPGYLDGLSADNRAFYQRSIDCYADWWRAGAPVLGAKAG
ncbi:MAG: phytanoyl-CoA dioxygenase family protein [Planctomycetes bacterium]|nr:phytanoyl-CoA dioxygenase family protein [Planctomycetota bacterium]